MILFVLACSNPVLQTGPIIDFHTHCPVELDTCDLTPLERAREGSVTAVIAGLNHYDLATVLGDPIPEEVNAIAVNNQAVQAAVTGSNNALLMPSLECLIDTPGSNPGFTAACLEDADRWIAEGAVGFKDHAGKTYDGEELDIARWVGAWNRYAGWCDPGDVAAPNQTCLADAPVHFPLAEPAYRQVIRAVVEDREKVWLTHAVPWSGSEDLCGTESRQQRCHEAAADALVEFAGWAAATLSPQARRRIVVAHLGFLQDDEDRLTAVLEAGLTVDLAQTSFITQGCKLRPLIASYPSQVVFGTDVFHGLDCVENHYEPWVHALIGEADRKRRFRNTCRGTLKPIGAALNTETACETTLPPGAGTAVLYGNAAEILGLE